VEVGVRRTGDAPALQAGRPRWGETGCAGIPGGAYSVQRDQGRPTTHGGRPGGGGPPPNAVHFREAGGEVEEVMKTCRQQG
jgi:hypothetical protein